jgi:hypothetical protein
MVGEGTSRLRHLQMEDAAVVATPQVLHEMEEMRGLYDREPLHLMEGVSFRRSP